MNKRVRTRSLIILGVTILSISLFAGFPPSVAKMKEKVHLGLDLRGGTQLVLEVVTDDAIRGETDQAIENIKSQLQKETIAARQITRTAANTFQVVGADPAKDADVRRILNERFTEWDLVSTAGEVPNTYTIKLKPNQEKDYRDQSVEQAIKTIRNRIDELGVGEVVIQKHGGAAQNEVLVQLPDVTDPARVKNIMQSTAQLELKLVDSGPYPNQAAAAQNYGGVVPANLEVLPSVERTSSTANSDGTFYVVQQVASVSGRDLQGALRRADGPHDRRKHRQDAGYCPR
jgi:preprotein translocase subunit SecD